MSRYIDVIVSDRQGEYLDTMVRTGAYGQGLDSVVSGLIAMGVQRAIEIGAINVALDPPPEVEEAPSVKADSDDENPF